MRNSQANVRFGALVVLATCFAVSALVRVGDVIAALPEGRDDSGFVNEPPGKGKKSAGDTSLDQVKAPEDVIAELKRQRELLDERKAKIEAREQQLQAIERRLSDRLKQLKAERERLAKTASTVHDAAGKDVRRLSEIYGSMKPKQAAQIFNQMAPSFAAGFLTEMRPDAAALIMANMEADKAYAVSLLIAGRNVKSPKADDATPATTADDAKVPEVPEE